MPYAAVDAVHTDPTTPMPVRDRGVTLDALPADAVDALLAAAGPDAPAPLAMVEIRLLGGAIGRRPEVDNAVAGRDAAFSVFTVGAPFGPRSTPCAPPPRRSWPRCGRGPVAGCSTSSARAQRPG